MLLQDLSGGSARIGGRKDDGAGVYRGRGVDVDVGVGVDVGGWVTGGVDLSTWCLDLCGCGFTYIRKEVK